LAKENIVSRNTRPVDFERATDYYRADSFGLLMKRVLLSMTNRTDGLLEPYGLTSAQGGPLMCLTTRRSSTVTEIARALQADVGATTRLIDRLERKGLCKRIRSSADRREMKVELTREGEASVSEVPGVLCTVMNEHLAGFSNSEWVALKRYLQRMAQNAEAMLTMDRALGTILDRPPS
jgi:DNA-binding MarR family transcriptional regulator